MYTFYSYQLYKNQPILVSWQSDRDVIKESRMWREVSYIAMKAFNKARGDMNSYKLKVVFNKQLYAKLNYWRGK